MDHIDASTGSVEATALPPRLLLIEDDPDTAMLMRECIEDHYGRDCLLHTSTLASARRIDLEGIDLVISDMNLPDGLGLELLPELLDKRPDLPVVFVTAEGIMETAIEAVKSGAYDYVVKAGDYLFALPVVIEKNLLMYRIKQQNEQLVEQVRVKNQQLEQMVEQLEQTAATDSLTGLANRRAFNRALTERFAEAVRHDQDLSLLLMDLDGFKQLNDTLGHQEGDRLLELVATVLRDNCRASDVAGRFGGDEFVLLLNQTDLGTARQVAQRVAQQIEAAARRDLTARGFEGHVCVSLGIASLRLSRPVSPEQMIGQADHAMYVSKAAAGSEVTVYEFLATPAA